VKFEYFEFKKCHAVCKLEEEPNKQESHNPQAKLQKPMTDKDWKASRGKLK
jgi:hypothetical protein